jgi:hypothetical protein
MKQLGALLHRLQIQLYKPQCTATTPTKEVHQNTSASAIAVKRRHLPLKNMQTP